MKRTEKLPETLSEQLRWYLEESGISTYRIEKETGVHNSILSRFMRDERGLSMDILDKLGVYLGLRLVKDRK